MTLQEFFNDRVTCEVVQDYLVAYIKEKGLEMMFNHEDTKVIGAAKDLIDGAFQNLDVQFGSKPDKEKKKIINEAR